MPPEDAPSEAAPPESGGAREAAAPHPRRRSGLVLAGGVAALLALATGAVAATVVAPPGRILPNVTVGGVAVGRLDAATARDLLLAGGPSAPVAPPRDLVLTTPDGVVLLPTAGLGLAVDPDATVARALAVGRSGGPRDLVVRLRSLARRTEVAPVLAPDATAVRTAVDVLADDLDRPADVGDVRIDVATRTARAVPPRRGITVRRDEAVAALTRALAEGDRGAITLPADVVPAAAGPAAAERLASRLAPALTGGLVLVADGRSLRVEPAELAGAIAVVAGLDADGRPAPVLRLDRRTIARTVGARLVAAFDREAVDARLDVPEPPRFAAMGSATFRPVPVTVALDPGRTARRFRIERTARQLEAMLAEGRRSAAADLEETPPAVAAADLLRHPLPTHLIGTFTTFHPAGADRTVNIRRLADTLDGMLVAPGADLSVNEASGERRCEDGYLLAGTIVRGELVDTCGGGVSQFGTTAYNAAFFAGLPTPEWQPHSFHIGRYPMGREATLSYPVLDVRAVNDTDGWLLVRTSHTPTSVTVALYGVPRWAEVRAVHGVPRDPTPFTTELRPAPDLAPGAERVLQAGGDGFTIDVARERVPLDGGPVVVERRTTVYRPQTRIVEVGVAPAPDPAAPMGR